MNITPIGVVYICMLVLFWFGKNRFSNLLLLCLITELFIETGYAIKYGDKLLYVFRLSEDVLIVYSILHLFAFKTKIHRYWFLLGCAYVIPLLLLTIVPSNAWVTPQGMQWDDVLIDNVKLVHPSVSLFSITKTISYILYLAVPIYLYSNYTIKDLKNIIKKMSFCIYIFLTIACLELFIKSFGYGKLWGEVIRFLFGETPFTSMEALNLQRGSSFGLNLFTREPSHYAYSLFIAAVILFANNVINGSKNGLSFSILLCIFMMCLSTSFSSMLYVPGFLLLWLLYRWGRIRPKSMKLEIVCSITIVVLLSLSSFVLLLTNIDGYLFGRLSDFVQNYEMYLTTDVSVHNGSLSTQVRILSVIQTMIAFSLRPLVGLSLGVISCHGATANFLASVGIIGCYFWIEAYFILLKKKWYRIHSNLYVWGVLIYLAVNLFNSFGLRPFFDILLIVIAASFCFIYIDSKKI